MDAAQKRIAINSLRALELHVKTAIGRLRAGDTNVEDIAKGLDSTANGILDVSSSLTGSKVSTKDAGKGKGKEGAK